MASRFSRWVAKKGKSVTLKSRAAAAVGATINKMGRETLLSHWPSATVSAFIRIVSPQTLSQLPEGTIPQFIMRADFPLGTGVTYNSVFYPLAALDLVTVDDVDYEVQLVGVMATHIETMCRRAVQ